MDEIRKNIGYEFIFFIEIDIRHQHTKIMHAAMSKHSVLMKGYAQQ